VPEAEENTEESLAGRMSEMGKGIVNMTMNASGAKAAAEAGNVVVIVDVIDMSTSLEAALDAGAFLVYGASLDTSKAPVKLSPEEIGEKAGTAAQDKGTKVVIICEPRIGSEDERKQKCGRVINGINKSGAAIEVILPNLGAELVKLVDFAGKVVIAVSDSGGVAYDAAWTAGAPAVLTGTVARTIAKRGDEPARAAARRAIEAAVKFKTGISVVAASANSLEDIMAAEYIVKMIIEEGFTAI
jgi:hypothetical protein